MKNGLTLLLILILSNFSYGQTAVINDIDGFTNVRELPKINAKIIYKLQENEVFSYQELKNETDAKWIKVYVSKNKYHLGCENNDTFMGYIHKSRLQPVYQLNQYNGSDFSFKYQLQRFSNKHKVMNFDGEWLTKINGRQFYGTDGDIPQIEVSGIDVFMDGKMVEIPAVLYQDIFECNNHPIIYKNQGEYIVHQWNSDGAGAYLIVWVLGNNALKQRLILIP